MVPNAPLRRTTAACLALSVLAALPPAPASAATYTWLGASNVTWATTTNWSSGTPAGTGDTAVFSGTATTFDTNIDIGSGITVSSILFTGGTGVAHSITAGSGSITINDGGTISYSARSGGSSQHQTISRPIVLSGSATFSDFNNTGGSNTDLLILSGTITGSNVITITGTSAASSSYIRVNANNSSTFTGSWDIRSGGLGVFNSNALGNATGVTLNGGAFVISGVTASRPVTWGSSASPINFIASSSNLSGDVTMNSSVSGTISTGGGNSGIQISGRILGDATNNITVNHGGTGATFTLSGAGSNTASGTTTFTTGGTYVLAKTGGATAIAGNLSVAPTATGTAFVRWDQSNQIADTSIVTLTASASTRPTWLRLNGQSDTIGGLVSTSTANVVENSLNSGTGTLTLSVASGTSYTFAGLLRNGTSATPGVLAIGMAGSGTQVFSGSNTFSGGVTIQGGVLQITNANALGTGTATVSAGTLDLGGLSTVANPVVLSGGTLANGTLNVSQLTATSGAVSASLTGGALSKSGAGMLTLSGSNDYSGGLALSGGVLNMNGSHALGTGTFTITGGTIGNTSGLAVTNANANAQAWNGDFTFAGPADLNLGSGDVSLAADRIVTVNASTLTIGGSIGGGYGLTKAGAGRLTLGADNGYTGVTTITGGTLALAGGGSFANSSRIIVGDADSSGAVLDLSQKSSLTIGAAQTLQGKGTALLGATTALTVAGTFSPGNSPGLFTYDSGSTTLAGTTLLEIWGTSRGANPGYDAVNVTNGGTLTLGGLLNLDFSQNFADATSFLLVDATAGALAGAFTSFTVTGAGSDYAGLTFQSVGSNVWETNATGNNQLLRLTETSSSLTLEIVGAVPEPASLTLAGIGLAATAWSVARRRRRT